MNYIIMYDIADEKRLIKIAKISKDYAKRIQYSIFLAHIKQKQLQEMIKRMKTIINNHDDNVKFCSLCEDCQKKHMFIGKNRYEDSSVYEVV